jgi:hypothetical protein
MNNKIQLKLQNELLFHSNSSEGYIFWLDLSNQNLPPVTEIAPKPFNPQDILTNLEQIAEIEKNKIKEINENVNIMDKRNKIRMVKERARNQIIKVTSCKLYTGAKDIASAANAILRDVENGRVALINNATIDVEWYKSNQISQEEFEFYSLRTTTEDVLRLAAAEYAKVIDQKWELLPLLELSQADQDRITEKK